MPRHVNVGAALEQLFGIIKIWVIKQAGGQSPGGKCGRARGSCDKIHRGPVHWA